MGSGIVERAGTLVVDARMNGRGMHWASRNLHPLLALRSRLCRGQWEQTWPLIHQRWRHEMRARQRQQRRARQAQRLSEMPVTETNPPPQQPRDKTIRDGRPTPAHPWYSHRGIFAA